MESVFTAVSCLSIGVSITLLIIRPGRWNPQWPPLHPQTALSRRHQGLEIIYLVLFDFSLQVVDLTLVSSFDVGTHIFNIKIKVKTKSEL